MSDTEADFKVESTESSASKTIPVRAGEVKKGEHCMLKGFPCKVVSVSVSKTGKHGHAKAKITGTDIFTQKKYVDISPTSHNLSRPVVKRKEYQVLDFAEGDDFCQVMNEEGETQDISVEGCEERYVTDIASEMEKAEKDVFVTVMTAVEKEGGDYKDVIVSVRLES